MNIFENTILVDKKVSVINIIGRVLCALLAAFCVVASFMLMLGILWIPAALFLYLWYVLQQESRSEYEYSYIEGRLSFAKIKAKSKRKSIANVDMEDVILIAPSDAHELYNYHNNHQTTVRDCTSGREDVKTYEVVYKSGTNTVDIVFEPDENMLQMIRVRYPKLVH